MLHASGGVTSSWMISAPPPPLPSDCWFDAAEDCSAWGQIAHRRPPDRAPLIRTLASAAHVERSAVVSGISSATLRTAKLADSPFPIIAISNGHLQGAWACVCMCVCVCVCVHVCVCVQRGSRQCSSCERWFRSAGGLAVHKCPNSRMLRAGRRGLPLLLRRLLRRRVCGSPSHAARPTAGPLAGAAALLVDSKSIPAEDGSLVVPIEHGP